MKPCDVSEDTKVLLLLCSDFALPTSSSLQPLVAREWARLTELMRQVGLKSPTELLAYNIANLGIPPAQVDRISRLLSRGGQLALEIESLTNQGLWIVGLTDEHYPAKYLARLSSPMQPPFLIGAGDISLLQDGYLAIVGSRDVDKVGSDYAEELGRSAATHNRVVVSGMARGVDQLSMNACMEAGGRSIGVMAGGLTQALRNSSVRNRIYENQLTLITALRPDAPFKVWNAMHRNKLIYCLADLGIVVSSGLEEGGTWAGAIETLKHHWVPLFVRNTADSPKGNYELILRGAKPIGDLTKDAFQVLLSHTLETAQFEPQPQQLSWPAAIQETADMPAKTQ